MRLIAFAVFAALASPSLGQTLTVPTDGIIRGAIETYIRPGFHAFAAEAATLKAATAALCAAPGTSSLETTQAQFKRTVLAYARVEFVHLGPLVVSDRLERILFWPDPKGIALKQVQAALGTRDPTTLDPEALKRKSVAMQGLVAVEYLLFGTGAETLAGTDGAYRCAYARSATTLIDGLATAIDGEWQDTATGGAVEQMLNPTPDGEEYRTPTEVLQKLTQSLFVGTDTIRDQRLTPIIGATEGKPRPRSALFWRSGLTIPMVAADFAGLREFYIAAGLPDALKAVGHASVSNGVLFEFDNVAKAAALITSPIEEAVGDPEQFKQLKYMSIMTSSMDTLLGQNLPDALGLTNGFSLLDGD